MRDAVFGEGVPVVRRQKRRVAQLDGVSQRRGKRRKEAAEPPGEGARRQPLAGRRRRKLQDDGAGVVCEDIQEGRHDLFEKAPRLEVLGVAPASPFPARTRDDR